MVLTLPGFEPVTVHIKLVKKFCEFKASQKLYVCNIFHFQEGKFDGFRPSFWNAYSHIISVGMWILMFTVCMRAWLVACVMQLFLILLCLRTFLLQNLLIQAQPLLVPPFNPKPLQISFLRLVSLVSESSLTVTSG